MQLINLQNDGTYTIPVLFQNQTEEEKETYSGTLQVLTDIFGPPREPDVEITQNYMDIAAALQSVLQACLMHILRHFKKETGQNNLCMAGGVALNCTANGVIKRSRMFKNMFIQPAAGDDGTALGAALYIQSLHQRNLCSKKMAQPLWVQVMRLKKSGISWSTDKSAKVPFSPHLMIWLGRLLSA